MIEIDLNIVHIILEILIVLLGLYLAFFKSYFQEKGKNLATKEDIKDITDTVETVKNQILYNTQTKLSLKAEERNSLVDSTEKYHYWLDSILNARYSQADDDSLEIFTRIETDIEEARSSYNLSVGRLDLYVDEQELKDLHHKLNIKTIELQSVGTLMSHDLKKTLLEIKFNKLQTPRTQEVQEEYASLLNKNLETYKKYNENKIVKYNEILPIHNEMKKKVYSHLKGLLDEE